MLVKLKSTAYDSEHFKTEGLIVNVFNSGSGYTVTGSELIRHGAPTEKEVDWEGFDPNFKYFLHASNIENLDVVVTWEEAAEACNNIFKTYHNSKIEDYVQSCSNNALPHSLTQMMATALAEDLTQDNKDVAVMVNAYKQLSKKGYVGETA